MESKTYCIIVTYQGENWIRKCLQSLYDSSVAVIPIVVDNGSADHTIAIVRDNFPEAVILENKQNLGFGGANNLGLLEAIKGGADHLFLLNQDAWVSPGCIQELLRLQNVYPEYGILSPVHMNGEGTALEQGFERYVARCYPDLPGKLSRGLSGLDPVYSLEFVNAAAWMLSRVCFERVGLFHPIFFHYGEDNNYVNRVKYHGWKIGMAPECRIFHDRWNKPVLVKKEVKRDLITVPLNDLLDIRTPSLGASYWAAALSSGGLCVKSLKMGYRSLAAAALFSFCCLVFKWPRMAKIRKETRSPYTQPVAHG